MVFSSTFHVVIAVTTVEIWAARLKLWLSRFSTILNTMETSHRRNKIWRVLRILDALMDPLLSIFRCRITFSFIEGNYQHKPSKKNPIRPGNQLLNKQPLRFSRLICIFDMQATLFFRSKRSCEDSLRTTHSFRCRMTALSHSHK